MQYNDFDCLISLKSAYNIFILVPQIDHPVALCSMEQQWTHTVVEDAH